MLGLPAATEVRKIITKKKIFEALGASMNPERRKRFDGEIARVTVVNEVSPASVNIEDGETVHSFFVLLIQLKHKDFDQQNIGYVSKLFGQKLVMVLEAEGLQRLALWQTRLIMGDWAESETLSIELSGVDLDQAWAHIVTGIAGIESEGENSLDEQIVLADRRKKLEREIERLEKKAWTERQPKRKVELAKRISKLKQELTNDK